MVSIQFYVNGKSHTVEVDSQMPLFWVIRDYIGLTGTKFGCGIAQCRACMVHVNGNPVTGCTTPVPAVTNDEITTIEGLSENNDHPVQSAWIEEQVPQCIFIASPDRSWLPRNGSAPCH